MNTELYRVVVDAEGRYLTEAEAGRIRDYAVNMGARLEAARCLEQAEDVIVEDALERMLAKYPDNPRHAPDGREKGIRDMKFTLRYLAAAHVRKDPDFFRRNFSSWVGEILRSVTDKQMLIDGQTCLRESIEKHVDAVDARAFLALHDIFLVEISR